MTDDVDDRYKTVNTGRNAERVKPRDDEPDDYNPDHPLCADYGAFFANGLKVEEIR